CRCTPRRLRTRTSTPSRSAGWTCPSWTSCIRRGRVASRPGTAAVDLLEWASGSSAVGAELFAGAGDEGHGHPPRPVRPAVDQPVLRPQVGVVLHARHVDPAVGVYAQGAHPLHDAARFAGVAHEQVDHLVTPLPLDDGVEVIAPPANPAG